MYRKYIRLSTLLLALAVVLGAFGAHGLKEYLPGQELVAYETGVRYHFYHAFALLICGILCTISSSKLIKVAGTLFMLGILLFSGSLYLLTAFKACSVEGFRWVGAITPLGGASFIGGWLCLFFAVPSMKSTREV